MATFTVQFSKPVLFTNQTGVKFTKAGPSGAESATVIATTYDGLGSQSVIEYTLTWVTEPIAGDIVKFEYTALGGNYTDGTNPMEDQDITLVNCADNTSDKYIDLDASTNGVGTQADPYNSFTELIAFVGDFGGFSWFIRAGNTYVGTGLALNNMFNFKLGVYGTGTRPSLTSTTLNALLLAGDNIEIDGLELSGSANNAIEVTNTATCNNLRITNCFMHDINGGIPENAVNIVPSATSTGIYIANNEVTNVGGNAFEFRDLDGAVFEDNYLHDGVQQSYEAWFSCSNVTIRRNRSINVSGNFVWFANEGGIGSHVYDSFVIENNVFFITNGGNAIRAHSGGTVTNIHINNNTFVCGQILTASNTAGASLFFMQNNIAYLYRNSTGNDAIIRINGSNIFSPGSVINNNWYFDSSPDRVSRYSVSKYLDNAGVTHQIGDAATFNSLQSWSAATGFDENSTGGRGGVTIGANDDVIDVFTDLVNADLTLLSSAICLFETFNTAPQASVALPAVADNLSSEDVEGFPRVPNNDVGGYQYRGR